MDLAHPVCSLVIMTRFKCLVSSCFRHGTKREQKSMQRMRRRMPLAKKPPAERKKHGKQQSVSNMLPRTSKRSVLYELFLSEDLTKHVLEFLPTAHLLVCSMVSSHLRATIDHTCWRQFAHDLMWWGEVQRREWGDRDFRSMAFFDEKTDSFNLEYTLTTPSARIMWLLNSSPCPGHVVRMRSNALLGVDSAHVLLDGKHEHIEKITTRGGASVDVLAWQIVEVDRYIDKQDGVGAVFGGVHSLRLKAVEFRHNHHCVKLHLTCPIYLTLHNVPLATDMVSYRCLWVARGIKMCMHCHQRPRSVQSFDAKHTDHRVLCSHCVEHLYVLESQLRRRWKVLSLVPASRVPRVHFVHCFAGAPTNICPTSPERYILKQDLASFFNCDSWTAFIQQNYKKQRKRLSWGASKDKFYFRSSWW